MKIESIRLKNYKVFRDVHLKDIPSFLVVVGANGSGKSTLFDVFGFLHDCLKGNVRQALDSRGRFREVLSRDALDDTILGVLAGEEGRCRRDQTRERRRPGLHGRRRPDGLSVETGLEGADPE